MNAVWSVTMYDGKSQLRQDQDRSLPHKLDDGVGDEEGHGRLADAVPSKGQSRPEQGSRFASGARMTRSTVMRLYGQSLAAFDLASRQRRIAARS